MFRIDDITKMIHLTRGDLAIIKLKLDEEETFVEGDFIEMRIYEARGLNKPPVLRKSIIVGEDTNEVLLTLESNETKFAPMLNRTLDYWYEIELNNNRTLIGFDDKFSTAEEREKGAKIFRVYPEGVELNG